MTPTGQSRDVGGFLARFFAPPNQINEGKDPRLTPWIDRLRRAEPLPSVLPCFRGGQVVDWYGVAFNERQWRSLGEDLTAFVGPTFTTFRGQRADLDGSEPIDAAVYEVTDGLAYKFRGEPSAGGAKAVWAALERLRGVWSRRPAGASSRSWAVGRILREFYMSLLAGSEDAARTQLEELRDHPQFDGLNWVYLRIQLLSAFGRSDEILRLQELPDLLRLRRPVAVTEAVVGAVYREELQRFEDGADPRGALSHFGSSVMPRYAGLYVGRDAMRSPAARKSFMLLAAAAEPPQPDVRDVLLAAGGLADADASYLALLAGLVPGPAAPSPADPLAEAQREAQRGDHDRAMLLVQCAPAGVLRARLLCECALELGTLHSRQLAREAVLGLGDPERAGFLQGRVNRELWERLQPGEAGDATEEANDALPGDLAEWLAYMDRHEGKRGSRELVRQGADEWDIHSLLGRPDGAARLDACFRQSRSQEAERVLRDCIPFVLAHLQSDPSWPNPALRGTYRFLTELLLVSTEGGMADFAVFNDLAEALLRLGVSREDDYAELVGWALDLWRTHAAPAILDWLVDFLELLAAFPCPAETRRREVCVAAVEGAQRFERRAGPETRDVLRRICVDLGQVELFDQYLPALPATQTEEADPLDALAEMSVTIYTLTEAAARQARNVLEARYPGVRVTLCHDHGASRRLVQLARQSDLFVVATGSAKHAATECIQSSRPRDRPTARPAGKGSASILRAIREALRQ
jgi:hypothetical protein